MNQELTPTKDWLAPSNRFITASRLHSRTHRFRLFVRKRWWIPMFITILVLVVVFAFSLTLRPTYKSTARMWLPDRLHFSEDKLYSESPGNFLGTQAELLRSRTLQNRALATLKRRFATYPALGSLSSPPASGWKSSLAEWVGGVKQLLNIPSPKKPSQTPEAAFPFKLKVTESYKNNVVDLEASGDDPELTQGFLNALTEQYSEFKKEVRDTLSTKTTASLTEQQAHLSRELQAQQQRLHAFQSSNNLVFLQEQGNSAGNYLATINRQLASLRTEYQLLQTLQPEHLLQINPGQEASGSSPSFPGAASLKELLPMISSAQGDLLKATQQIELLKAKRDELLRFLRPIHPKIVKLNESIAAQQKLVNLARADQMKVLENRRQSMKLEIQNLETAFREWDGKAIEASRKMADYERMRQDLQHTQTAYERLLALTQNVDIGKSIEQENLAVLEAASAPASSNPLLINLALGLVGSLLLSCGILFLSARFDDRFETADELRHHFSEPLLGVIPDIPLQKPKGRFELKTLQQHRFEFLESFRNIRSSLLFNSQEKLQPRTILVGSSIPSEGKTTVSLYLASVLAMGGARVLLVDADLRRPSLHKHFGLDKSPGLAECLETGTDPLPFILPSSVRNLDFLPAGHPRANPGELFLSPHLKTFLRTVYSRFDFIILNSPPVLAADDASTLAPNVDGVLFVVRGSFTSARQAHHALGSLKQRGVKVLGLVFNRVAFSANERHHYTDYRRAYQWKPQAYADQTPEPDAVPRGNPEKELTASR